MGIGKRFTTLAVALCATMLLTNCGKSAQQKVNHESITAYQDDQTLVQIVPNPSSGSGTLMGTSDVGGSTELSSEGGTDTVTPAQLYNFVAGTKQACEDATKSRLGVCSECTVGGGCGLSCGKPGGSCVSANPTLYGACVYEDAEASCRGVDPAPKKACQTTFDGGGVNTTQLASQAECMAQYRQLNAVNQTPIKFVRFDGVLIVDNTKPCVIVFNGGGTLTDKEVNVAGCRKDFAQIQRLNPNSTFKTVSFNGNIIEDFRKVCKLTFGSGATTSINDAVTETDCLKYFRAIRDANPKANIVEVKFNGKILK